MTVSNTNRTIVRAVAALLAAGELKSWLATR
jgi:hypothetical protein